MKILNHLEMIQAFMDGGIAAEAETYLDAAYALPSRHWIEHEFEDALATYFQKIGLIYNAEDSDCDDFAFEAFSFARRCHRFTTTSSGATIALGLLQVPPAPGSRAGHMLNCVILNEAPYIALPYEPQGMIGLRAKLHPDQLNPAKATII